MPTPETWFIDKVADAILNMQLLISLTLVHRSVGSFVYTVCWILPITVVQVKAPLVRTE